MAGEVTKLELSITRGSGPARSWETTLEEVSREPLLADIRRAILETGEYTAALPDAGRLTIKIKA